MASSSESNWVESAHSSAEDLIRVSIGEDGFRALIGGAGQAESVTLSISWDLLAQVVVARGAPSPLWLRGQQPYPLPLQTRETDAQEARFIAQLDDYAVWANDGYLAAVGWTPERLAVAARRWAETGCDAYQLNDALWHTAQRQTQAALEKAATLALHIRPRLTAIVWSGPPLRIEDDQTALNWLMAEPGARIICGDTTAQIAARLLGRPLRVEQAAEGRSEVPPLAYLAGVQLVTEGAITLQRALEWLQGAKTARDLPRHVDAATRLAGMLLGADSIQWLVGQALNRAQAAAGDPFPVRLRLIEELATLLRARGKLVRMTLL
jgi:hypothetical protein